MSTPKADNDAFATAERIADRVRRQNNNNLEAPNAVAMLQAVLAVAVVRSIDRNTEAVRESAAKMAAHTTALRAMVEAIDYQAPR